VLGREEQQVLIEEFRLAREFAVQAADERVRSTRITAPTTQEGRSAWAWREELRLLPCPARTAKEKSRSTCGGSRIRSPRPGLAGADLQEELVMAAQTVFIDAAGRRRSPATIPGHLGCRAPRNKGMQYPPDPPRAEEIIAIMRQAGHDRHGLRVRALIAVLWRGGLRISEALALNETDIDDRRGSLLIRHGKGDKRREAGMDQFGFEQLATWLAHRVLLPPGPLFCVIDGQTRGRRWSATAARAELRQLALEAGVRRRFAPHHLRHAHAVELAREGVAVNIIQRQLGHTDLGTTSTYLQGIDPSEIIDAVRSRRPPTITATAGLSL
jgi:integrase